VEIHVDALAQRMGRRNLHLRLSDDAKAYLAKVSMNAGSGARYVQRTVSHYISTPLSTAILRGELKDGAAANVTLEGASLIVRAA
jgi:ATP-dependent Clp protease ATP-binding subunit ClpA